jgi:hypothetical protein
VAVALAVDGLNTIDAAHTEAWSARKWVLGPHETVVIPGWQVSGAHARRFTFTGERGSYGAALGQTDNLGVIEAVFYREAPRPVTVYDAPPCRDDWDWRDLFGQERGAAEERSRPAAPSAGPEPQAKRQADLSDEYAGTGMGSRTRHSVTEVDLELESSPSATVRVRYEFRPVLVKLGVLPAPCPPTRLEQRESGRGFEMGFCPEPDRRR